MIDIFTVDAFTTNQFEGNPAGVVPFADTLTEEQMQNIATEINLSETAFLLKPTDNNAHFKVRYFTRTNEIDFCGHATVALSWVLGSIYQYTDKVSELILETNIGIITVEFKSLDNKLSSVLMRQVTPKTKDIEDIRDMIEILGLKEKDYDNQYPIKLAYTGNWHLLIPLKTKKAVDLATPDYEKLGVHNKKHNISTTHLFTFDTQDPNYLLYTRDFAPREGVNEDPVTGSANGALAGYLDLEEYLPINNEYKIKQTNSFNRIGELLIKTSSLDNKVSVQVGGSAVIMFQGKMNLL